MSKSSVEAYADAYVWFKNNYGRLGPSDPEKRFQFLVKAIQCQMDILATLIEEQQAQRPQLFLPRDLRVTGDLTRLG